MTAFYLHNHLRAGQVLLTGHETAATETEKETDTDKEPKPTEIEEIIHFLLLF
jgi:hypothetical protein